MPKLLIHMEQRHELLIIKCEDLFLASLSPHPRKIKQIKHK